MVKPWPISNFRAWGLSLRAPSAGQSIDHSTKSHSQSGSRFESLTLSHNNMIALKPVLLAWLEEAEAARRDPEGANGLLPSGEKKRD